MYIILDGTSLESISLRKFFPMKFRILLSNRRLPVIIFFLNFYIYSSFNKQLKLALSYLCKYSSPHWKRFGIIKMFHTYHQQLNRSCTHEGNIGLFKKYVPHNERHVTFCFSTEACHNPKDQLLSEIQLEKSPSDHWEECNLPGNESILPKKLL
jgi:hypothetical protein